MANTHLLRLLSGLPHTHLRLHLHLNGARNKTATSYILHSNSLRLHHLIIITMRLHLQLKHHHQRKLKGLRLKLAKVSHRHLLLQGKNCLRSSSSSTTRHTMLASHAHQGLMSKALQSKSHFSKIISKKVRLQHPHLAQSLSRLASPHCGRSKPLQVHQSHQLPLEKQAFCLRAQHTNPSAHHHHSQLFLRQPPSQPSSKPPKQRKGIRNVVAVLSAQEKAAMRLQNLVLHRVMALPPQSRRKVSLSNASAIWHQPSHLLHPQSRVLQLLSQAMNLPSHKLRLRRVGNATYHQRQSVRANQPHMSCGRGIFPRSPHRRWRELVPIARRPLLRCRLRIVMRLVTARRSGDLWILSR